MSAEITTLRNRKVSHPPPAQAPDICPCQAKFKTSHNKLASWLTQLGSLSRLFAKTMLQGVSAAKTEVKRLLTQVRSQKLVETFGDKLDGLLAAVGAPPKSSSTGASPLLPCLL